MRFNRYKTPFSIIMLDIDNFKLVNDNYGHKSGDMVLQKITKLIKDSIRNVDTIGRYGGEEFIVILPNTSIKGACLVGENLRKKIEDLVIENVGKVTISCGIEEFTSDTEDALKLIYHADKKFYIAKNSGRNKVIGI